MMKSEPSDPIITVTLESADMEMPVENLDITPRNAPKSSGSVVRVPKSLSPPKNFWVEMPQMIVVETRFITQQIATQNKIYSAQTLLQITDQHNSIDIRKPCFAASTQTTPPPQLVDVGSLVKPDVADVAVSTDSPNPCRNRAQQTSKSANQTTTIGIQCNLEDDMAFPDMYSNIDTTAETDDKHEFLKFTEEKSIFYLNGRTECTLCGEVEISTKRMLSHLALHWGPPALCHLCGLQFEHQMLMATHDCEMKKQRSKKRRKVYQQCPIFWCGSVKNSLPALNVHIRKHLSTKYRRACVTFALDRTMVLKRPSVVKTNSLLRCNICLQRCQNASKFARHRKVCILNFMGRLKEQKVVEPLLILCNE
ncbi:uncharacterized protein LOC129236055 isoform X2 [Anastrepha obliqua]|uniref:uncharacterized protein LOC129236055 isoform X2 n=1 Tax=Anastrepha obliqua TaxID=95512 RepID=UPI0024095DC5|nr:uncharacterized protein LOC129236055 isoform X2 [Anastrepha obliqua]